MIKCKICENKFSSEKSFHAHLKKHGMYQAEYYCKYYPRYSTYYKKQIPFTNKKEIAYFALLISELLETPLFLLGDKL